MAVNTSNSTTVVTDPVPESLTVTIRVPANADGTLADVATEKVLTVSSITDVTFTETVSVNPRNGATYITAEIEPVTNAVSGTELFDEIDDTIAVDVTNPDVT